MALLKECSTVIHTERGLVTRDSSAGTDQKARPPHRPSKYFLRVLIYFFLEREKGRKGEGEVE